ncbi:hypothetical protein COOONC_03938 [Cooperia oncophora]
MIGILLLPLCVARSPNGTRRCVDGKSYIFHDVTDRPIGTNECCTGFSKDEVGNCVAAVPRFAAAISLVFIAWILIAVFSMVIAYVTMMERNRKGTRNSMTNSGYSSSEQLLNKPLPSTSQLVAM